MINAPQSVIDALESDNFRYANILDVNLGDAYGNGDDLVLHITDFGHDISFEGVVYTHDNVLSEIEGIARKASTGSDKVDIVFSITDETLIEAIVARRYVNKPTTIRRILLDDNSNVIGNFPIPIRTAWGISHAIEGDIESRAITLTIDSQLGDLNSDNGWYAVNSSHQQRYPDDFIMNASGTVMTDEQSQRYTTSYDGVISQQNKPPALSVVYGYKNVELVPLLRYTHRKSHSSYRHHYTTWIYCVCIGDAVDVDLASLTDGDDPFNPDIVTSTATDQSGWEMRLRRPSRADRLLLDDSDLNFFFDYMDANERARFNGMYGKGLTLLFLYNRSRDGYVDTTPSLKVPVRGHQIYDPRADTYGFSRNPALQYGDYLQSTMYGAGGRGVSVSQQDIIDLANHFDAIPESEGNAGINSILMDVQIDTAENLVDNMNIWMEGMRMFTSDYYGEFRLRVETIAPVVRSYVESDLEDFPEYESGEFTDRMNQLTYTVNQLVPNPAEDAEPNSLIEVSVEATFPEDDSDIHQQWLAEDDGMHHFDSSELSHVTVLEQAYYWAMVDARISRKPDTLSLPVGAVGWLHEVGDVIEFSSEVLEMDKTQWRIEEVSEDEDELTLDLKPYDATFYTPDPDAIPDPIAPARPPSDDKLSAVEDLDVTVEGDSYVVSWEQDEPVSGYHFNISVTFIDPDEVIPPEGEVTIIQVVDAPVVYNMPFTFQSELEGLFTVNVIKINGNNESAAASLVFLSESPEPPTVEVQNGSNWITLIPNLTGASIATRFRFYIAQYDENGDPLDDLYVSEGYSFTQRGLLPLTEYEYNVTTVNALGESEKTNIKAVTTDHDDDVIVQDPTVPSGVVIAPLIASLNIFWDVAGYVGHSYANIYYQSVSNTDGVPDEQPDFTKASVIASSVSNGVIAQTGGSSSGYIWLTNVNLDRKESLPNVPQFAIPQPTSTGSIGREDLDDDLNDDLIIIEEGIKDNTETLEKIDPDATAYAGIGTIIDSYNQSDKRRLEIHSPEVGMQAQITDNMVILIGEDGVLAQLESSLDASIETVDIKADANYQEIVRVEATSEVARATIQEDLNVKFETVDSKANANALTITQVEADADSARATMQTELEASIDTVDSKTNANALTITQVEADADSARAAMKTELEASIDTVDSKTNANASTITQVEADAESARAAMQTSLEASIDTVDSKADANLLEIARVETDAESARATMQTGLEASIEGVDSKVEANALTITQVETDAEMARSQMQTTLQSGIDGNSSAIQTNLQSITTINDDGSTAYQNQWSVKSSINDVQRGVGFYDDGTDSSFLVLADTFAVLNTDSNSPINPFVVDDGKVFINDAVINDAYIQSLVTSEIITDTLYGQTVSTVRLKATEINTWSTGEWNTNYSFNVSRDGFLRAKSATLTSVDISSENTVGQSKLTLNNDRLEVYDESGVLRVVLGRL